MPKKSRRHRSAVQRRTAVQAQRRPAATPAEPSTATATASPAAETVPATAAAAARPAARPRTIGGARPGTPSGSRPLYDYRYTLREARRMGLLAAALFVILAILGFILR